jgi:hypothetical protein
MRKLLDSEIAGALRACEAYRAEGGPRRARLAKLKQETEARPSRAAWIERRERDRAAERAFHIRMENYFFPRRVNDLLRSKV